MKRKGFHALKLAATTAIVTALAVPALAHGMSGSGWSTGPKGGQMMSAQGGGQGGMMGPQGGGMMGGGQGGMMGMMGGGMMGGGMMGMGGMSAMAEKFDANGDGKLTPDELRAGLTAKLREFDADGNGSLSLEEFEALHAAMIRNKTVDRFQFLDDDGDGQVTAEEIARPAKMLEMRQKLRKQMPGQGRMQGTPCPGRMMQGNAQGQGSGMMQGNGMMKDGDDGQMMQGQKKKQGGN